MKVYAAADGADAHLVFGLLQEAGIESTVMGEVLGMARGEIPVGPSTAPAVWVREPDALRAREIIDNRKRERRPSWRCPKCDQLIEGQFTDCWRCSDAEAADS